MNRKFEIKEEELGRILNYLSSKPFNEVAKMITDLQQLKEIKNGK